jgi:beta-xylosidase
LLLKTLAVALLATQYQNPILFADYSDPDVIRVGPDYYLVASSFHFSPGLPVLQSRDLVHWKIIGHVLPRLPFAPEYNMVPPFTLTDATSRPVGPGLRYAGGVWAPAIRHHDGLFYAYWPTPQEGIFMATARRPEGPWSEPVAVIPGPGFEDPCPFWDDDGQAYLVHSRVGAGPLILHRMSTDGTKVLDEGQTIVADPKSLPVLEGPKLYKRNGWYYIFAPIGGVEKGTQAVLRARDIQGPYESRVVLAQGDTSVQGPHQGGYVETPTGQGWFVHFNSTGAFGRIVHLEPVRWEDDWPVIGDPVPGKSYGQPVASHSAPAPSVPARLQDSDEFSGRTLGLQWEWNHNPDDSRWSLRARPGFLRLTASPADNLVTARNTLTQILQGPRMQATTRIDITHMADGQRAGLAMFGVRPGWIGVTRQNGHSNLTFSAAGVESPGPVLHSRTVDLRVEVAAEQSARFFFSLDEGRTFQPYGDVVPLQFSWWKGARPALFTYGSPGWVDVDWFRISH